MKVFEINNEEKVTSKSPAQGTTSTLLKKSISCRNLKKLACKLPILQIKAKFLANFKTLKYNSFVLV